MQTGKKIKICHIATASLGGGASKNIAYTLQGLDKSRYGIDFVIGRYHTEKVTEIENVNLIVFNTLVRKAKPLLDLITILRLLVLIRSRKYDIVHTHQPKAGFLGTVAAWMARAPVIIHGIYGTTFHRSQSYFVQRFYIFLEKLAAKLADCNVVNGEDMKRKYIENGIGDPAMYCVIYSGINLSEFYKARNFPETIVHEKRKQLGVGKDDIIIGNVALLEPQKGHIYSIEAAKRIVVENPRAKFLFAGSGYYREELERLVSENALSQSIIFTGYRTDIAEVMSTFDILLLTSIREGLPQVFVQASLLGKPIVTFDVEGSNQIVNETKNGFVVPLKDVNQLVERLKYLINNLSLAKEIGSNGAKILDFSMWSIETRIRTIAQLYEKLEIEKL